MGRPTAFGHTGSASSQAAPARSHSAAWRARWVRRAARGGAGRLGAFGGSYRRPRRQGPQPNRSFAPCTRLADRLCADLEE